MFSSSRRVIAFLSTISLYGPVSAQMVQRTCVFPALPTVLLASDGGTRSLPASSPATEDAAGRGVSALFSWGDVDGDGRLDLAAVSGDGTLQILANTRDGRFEDVTERVGLFDVGSAALALWADYDGDGRLDLFVGAREGASRLFHNDYGVFTDVSARSGIASDGAVRSAQWLDEDGDGRLDLFVATAEKNLVFRGLQGGSFEVAEIPCAPSTRAPDAPDAPPGSGVVPWNEEAAREGSIPGLERERPHGGRFVPPASDGSGGSSVVVTSTTPLGSNFPVLPPTSCLSSITDQAVPANCLSASTTPTLGMLYPISANLFVAVGGSVGIGTTTPAEKLDIAGSVLLSAVAPNSLRIRNGATEVAELGVAFQALQYSIDAQANDAVLRNMAPGKSIHIQSGSGFAAVTISGSNDVGIGTPTPGAKLDVAGTARITDTLTLNPSGDVALDVSTGSIYMGGDLFIHVPFSSSNTAIGSGTLASVTNGQANTAVGLDALNSNTTGTYNTASGRSALESNTTGGSNTAIGVASLADNTTGDDNIAVGQLALSANTSGSGNIAIGYSAGSQLTTGDNNIAIGDGVFAAGESATIRIGRVGTHTKAFFAGIRGVTTGIANAFPIMVDSNGQLGTANSSRRFKKDIADMGDATERLLELRPVLFRYKQEQTLPGGQEVPPEYGLIAEEVAEILPDLVIYDDEGLPLTVKYHHLSSMLLNELKKLNERCEAQNEKLQGFEARLASIEARTAQTSSPIASPAGNR